MSGHLVFDKPPFAWQSFAVRNGCSLAERRIEGKELSDMTVEAHLASLQQKHGTLEDQIHTEMLRPAGQDQVIADLKRKKLRLKDEIERLRAQMRH